ncbi:MAG TPA: hypothetical protein VII64_12800 [Thermodesulfobacteriota bacterium]
MRTRELRRELRHSGIGILLGLLCLIFGISWAVYLTANHDSIHRQLEAIERAALEEKFVINTGGGHEGHGAGHSERADTAAHDHSAHMHEGHGEPAQDTASGRDKELSDLKNEPAGRAEAGFEHGPVMGEAHERLTRGHLHAMGLGTLTIIVSLLLAFIPASQKAKTLAAACLGTGSFFYPLAWIVMGFRTPVLGGAGAQESVFPMAAFSIALVSAGLLLTLAYVVRWIFGKD